MFEVGRFGTITVLIRSPIIVFKDSGLKKNLRLLNFFADYR